MCLPACTHANMYVPSQTPLPHMSHKCTLKHTGLPFACFHIHLCTSHTPSQTHSSCTPHSQLSHRNTPIHIHKYVCTHTHLIHIQFQIHSYTLTTVLIHIYPTSAFHIRIQPLICLPHRHMHTQTRHLTLPIPLHLHTISLNHSLSHPSCLFFSLSYIHSHTFIHRHICTSLHTQIHFTTRIKKKYCTYCCYSKAI